MSRYIYWMKLLLLAEVVLEIHAQHRRELDGHNVPIARRVAARKLVNGVDVACKFVEPSSKVHVGNL